MYCLNLNYSCSLFPQDWHIYNFKEFINREESPSDCLDLLVPVTCHLKEKFSSFQGVQRKMISVDNFFRIFQIIIFCFVVAICDLVHTVEATYGIP